MRICVLQSSCEGSKTALTDVDIIFPNSGAFTSQHSFENRFIHKGTAKEEIDAVIAESFDFHINFLRGTLDDDVAGVEASRYFEAFGVPSAGIRSWERLRTTNEFYDNARRRGAPPVPGKEGFPTHASSSDPESPSRDDILVQEYLDGRDCRLSVIAMGDSALALQPCLVHQRQTSDPESCITSDMKFHAQTRLELMSRAENPTLYDRLQEVALEAFNTGLFRHNYIGCDVYMRARPNGEVIAIDVNSLPVRFLPDDTGFANSPIPESLPGGHAAVVNIFIANYFLQNKPLREWPKVAEIYDSLASSYDESMLGRSQLECIIRGFLTEFDYEGILVDLACGTGVFGRLLAERESGDCRQSCGQVIGFDLSPKMVDVCRTLGFYNGVYLGRMQTCLLEHFAQGEVDHIVCFSAAYHLSPEEFAFLLVSCFVVARKSITIGVDEIPDVYNETHHKTGSSFMHSFNHLQNMEAFRTPQGWSLVKRERQYGWSSPSIKDDVYITTFRFERVDQRSVHDFRLLRLTTKN